MDQEYACNQQKLEALADAYAAQCAQAQADRDAVLEREQQAADEELRALYALPRQQIRVDLEAMQSAVSAFINAQKRYPADDVTLEDCCRNASVLPYDPARGLEAFSECAHRFQQAAEALARCHAAENPRHLQTMADCLKTAQEMDAKLESILDAGYPTAQLRGALEERLAKCRAACDRAVEDAARIETMPEYRECQTLKQTLLAQTEAQKPQLLSCDRLGHTQFPERILLGTLPYTLTERAQRFCTDQLGLDPQTLSAGGLSLPVCREVSSLVVNASAAQIESRAFEDMLVSLFLQILVSFPTKYLHVCGMQENLSGVVSSLVSELGSAVGDSVTFGGAKSTAESIAEGVDEISRLMEERVCFYGRKYADIYDYNEKSPDTRHPFVLLLIHNYPYGFEERSVRRKVENILESGGRCGILTVLVNCTDAHLERFGEPVPPLDTAVYGSRVAQYEEGPVLCADGKRYRCDITAPGFSEGDFWQRLSESTRYVSRPIMLDSILSLPYERRPYYDELRIPVGRTGNDLQFFCLDVESTGKAAALIAGGTGSGKTTFLHTLILSGAAHYSPEELEFYLIDFKDGVEFSNYLKKEDEPSAYIPHVSFLSLKNRVEDAYDVLHKIAALKTERNRLFNLAGATDFKTYHMSRKVQSGELPKLRRTIVIIDEYQNLLEPAGNGSAVLASKCAGRLLALLKEVRNAGISIILSSQAICVGREAKDQIFNRVVFSGSETTINSAFETSRSAEMMSELQRERGLAYLSEDGGVHTSLFKSAWAGKTNGEEHRHTAAEICRKWQDVPENRMIISGNAKELLIGEGSSELSMCGALSPDEDLSVYSAVIGQSFLSDEPIALEFTSAAFSSYAIIGDLQKTRNLEASAALGFLLELRRDGCALQPGCVSYCDMNYTSEGRKHKSPLEDMAAALSDAVSYLKSESEIADRISELHALYHTRLEALKSGQDIDLTPRLLILNAVHNVQDFALDAAPEPSVDTGAMSAFDRLLMDTAGSSSGGARGTELVDQLTLLYERGFEQHIFVILSEKEPQRIRDLIPRGVRYERGVYCSKAALSAADWSSAGEGIAVDELAENCCVVLPNVSKVRPYTFHGCEAWFARYQALLKG